VQDALVVLDEATFAPIYHPVPLRLQQASVPFQPAGVLGVQFPVFFEGAPVRGDVVAAGLLAFPGGVGRDVDEDAGGLTC